MTRQHKKGSFPRLSLTAGIKIIKEASQLKGKIARTTFAQFGARKNEKPSITSGAFNDKINALRSFGLITIENENIELTDLANKIVDPLNTEEVEKALLQCFMNIETFKGLFNTLKTETPVTQTVLQEQAVNTIGINRNQRKKFVDFFVNAAERVGLIARIDKNTIKPKASTLLEAFGGFFTASPLNTPPIETPKKNDLDNAKSEQIFYPYTDKGEGWQLEIKITSNKKLTPDVRDIRNKLADLLEIINEGNEKI